MIKLPEKFKARMLEMLGTGEFSAYEDSLNEAARSGLRINTLKLDNDSDALKKLSCFTLETVPWLNGVSGKYHTSAFFYGDNDQPSKHPFYYAGLYYIQEPSAMTPAHLFDVRPGDKVLDLCAAPGGKSTALGAKLCGSGLLVGNDVSNSRAKALLKNIELFGITNALVVSETPDKLAQRFEGFFDKIIVDAPCSGEGMFRKQPSIMNNWEQYGCEYYSALQHEILPSAVKMLAPGGKLMYSTCTFSPLEDEELVVWLLNRFPELRLGSFFDEELKAEYSELGFAFGRKDWLSAESAVIYDRLIANGNHKYGLEETVRLFPHKIDGEGHFIALFEKSEDAEPGAVGMPYTNQQAKGLDELYEFLTHLKMDVPKDRIAVRNDMCFLRPGGLPDTRGLRVLREGLLLGEMKKNRFEPSQALAMAITSPDMFDNVYDMPADDPNVIRYLKCESIEVPESLKDGYVLVCTEGLSLGFGKLKNGVFKNRYLPGWRMM